MEIENEVMIMPVKRKRGRPPKAKTGTGDVPETKTGTGKEQKQVRAKKGTGKKRGRKNKGYDVSPAALMQRRTNAASLPARTDEERAYNTQLINHAMRIHEIATHADIKDPVSLRSCFIAYLKLCQEDGFRVGNLAAATAMGINIRTLYLWLESSKPEYRELAEFVQGICALSREGMIADQKINPVTGIFWQRNFDFLRNDTEQVQSMRSTVEDPEDAGDIVNRYGHLLDS